MNSTDFLQRFEELVGASGWHTLASPARLIQQWADFVAACESGYGLNIYEYENERSVRDLLERALQDPALNQFSELSAIREAVEQVDARFRKATRDDVEVGPPDASWWRRRILRRAGREYAGDVKMIHGIDVETTTGP